uniref:Uncharacterized protein n=1 Tax=Anguilla anguilla TaxID=7936 RepID=A0A0E9VSK5_ANGAN
MKLILWFRLSGVLGMDIG